MAALITKISGLGASTIVEQLPSTQSSQIVTRMSHDQQVNLLRKVGEESAEAILEEIKPQKAQKIRKLMSNPDNTAGALMITDYLAYVDHQQVGDVLDDLRRHGEQYSDYEIQYAYVVSETGKLVGVLRLRDLLMSPKHQPITETMVKDPLSVPISAPLRDLRDFFMQYNFLGVPVIDDVENLVSLAANTLVAVSFGGLVPLILRGMRTDPALASGPLLTTITDMCGFSLY
jgi:magnesium transporter